MLSIYVQHSTYNDIYTKYGTLTYSTVIAAVPALTRGPRLEKTRVWVAAGVRLGTVSSVPAVTLLPTLYLTVTTLLAERLLAIYNVYNY